MDYFISGATKEPENGQDHYTETVFCLPSIAIYFPLPDWAETGPGPDGNPGQETTYFCSQSLYKLLPQDDDLYPQIAKRVAGAKFLFLAHNSKRVTRIFRDRLSAAFSAAGLDADEYCQILPRVSPDEFVELNRKADILLDSTNWSGGGGTSLVPFALNKPVVTLPGQFMRGRHTYGMLMQMGIPELIAGDKSDYVDISVELGKNKSFYSEMRKKINENKKTLFDDKTTIQELEKFLVTIASDNG